MIFLARFQLVASNYREFGSSMVEKLRLVEAETQQQAEQKIMAAYTNQYQTVLDLEVECTL